MKFETILFGTGNRNKLRDISLAGYTSLRDLKILTLKDLEAQSPAIGKAPDVEETEDNYTGNALIKARAYSHWSGLPCIADDSGVEVAALNGAPGVYSAHYAGELHNDAKNNQKLIEDLKGIKNRSARFVSTVVLYVPGGITLITEGEIKGTIIDEPRGEGGWGYEPHFLCDEYGKTLPELRSEKAAFKSHRHIAMDKLFAFIS